MLFATRPPCAVPDLPPSLCMLGHVTAYLPGRIPSERPLVVVFAPDRRGESLLAPLTPTRNHRVPVPCIFLAHTSFPSTSSNARMSSAFSMSPTAWCPMHIANA